MHYFLTGHTGFKGSWLILLLRELGHTVSGYSLNTPTGGLFEKAELATLMRNHLFGDVRNALDLTSAITAAKPDVAIHLAAQPLVIKSFHEPKDTITTNVNGTLNFLLASQENRVPVSLVVTTDKVYRDSGKTQYQEDDALGGWDPYSASKAMADILSQSIANLSDHSQVLIARAGNVIGAFDSAENRLMPDINRAIRSGLSLAVRNPRMVRPWQHVLDCLSGYLSYVDLALERNQPIPRAMNFGPESQNFKSVLDVVKTATQVHPFKYELIGFKSPGHKETSHLTLDTALARRVLGWNDKISFEEAVRMSIENQYSSKAKEISREQVKAFLSA